MAGLLATSVAAGAGQRALLRAEWMGVERIVVGCDADSGIDHDLHDRLCAAVLRGVRARTAYPVVRGDEAPDAVPDGSTRHDLRLIVAVTRGSDGLAVTLRLARHAFVQVSDAMPEQRLALPPAVTTDDRALGAALAPALDTLFPRASHAGHDSRQY